MIARHQKKDHGQYRLQSPDKKREDEITNKINEQLPDRPEDRSRTAEGMTRKTGKGDENLTREYQEPG